MPASEHSVDVLMGRIEEATGRLLATASALTDEQARGPSLLPGWSRGHVLSHVARNADGLANLLTWAKTGVETPQYPSRAVRDAQIEEGAGRPAGELAADVSRSAQAFAERARELSGDEWQAEVRGMRGPAHPAWFTLHRRLNEVEIHHVDLAAGYAPPDWPGWYVSEMLGQVAGQLAGDPGTPAAVVMDASTGARYALRPDTTAQVTIVGQGHELLAWLLGRGDGAGLATDPAGPLPSVPSY